MLENGEPEISPSADRRAAWWSWPVILASLALIAWGVNFIPVEADPAIEAPPRPVANAADLAILKIQAQIVIGSQILNPVAAETSLKDLRGFANDDRSIAAVALLEDFISKDDAENKTLSKKGADSSAEVLLLSRKAVTAGLDENEREELRSSLGWFADLAPGPGLEQPVEAENIRTKSVAIIAVGGLLLMLAAAALIAGAILLIIHVHRWMNGVPVNRFDPAAIPRGIMLECFALYLGLMVLGEFAAGLIHPSIQIAGYAISVVVPLLWPMLRGIRWMEFRKSLGLHSGEGWLKEIGAGFVGYLGMLSVASIGIFLTVLLTYALGAFGGAGSPGETGAEPIPVTPQTHPIVGWIYAGDWKARVLCLLLASGFAPLFEEIFFRGAMHRYLRGKMKFLWAALATSLIFAALHPQGVVGIPALAAIGVGLSFIREWRDSLIAPMVAHAINNGVLVCFLWLVL